jgi:NCAIR mutase (PurE)-related protein
MENIEVRLDFSRKERKGFPEIIYCPGKSKVQMRKIAEDLKNNKTDMAFSRMSEDQVRLVSSIIPDFKFDSVSRLGWTEFSKMHRNALPVAVLSAGSTDVPVAEEAARVAEFAGCEVRRYYDVGVSGLHRVMSVLPEIREAGAVIVAGGMDGALANVVAGLVPSLVIGLPTSIGYGVAEKGMTSLRAMLCSSSPGLVVVNIDNGIGAGLAAVLAASKK